MIQTGTGEGNGALELGQPSSKALLSNVNRAWDTVCVEKPMHT